MGQDKTIVRQEIEKISGVIRTWFEWELMNDGQACCLVIEVDRSTDPNAPDTSLARSTRSSELRSVRYPL